MPLKTIQVITRAANGSLRVKEYENFDELNGLHEQIAIDDCSTDLTLRGMPVFRGLVGPIADSKHIVRYESPDVFESLTKEWTQTKIKRRRRISTTASDAAEQAAERTTKPGIVPIPKFVLNSTANLPRANV